MESYEFLGAKTVVTKDLVYSMPMPILLIKNFSSPSSPTSVLVLVLVFGSICLRVVVCLYLNFVGLET